MEDSSLLKGPSPLLCSLGGVCLKPAPDPRLQHGLHRPHGTRGPVRSPSDDAEGPVTELGLRWLRLSRTVIRDVVSQNVWQTQRR